MLEMDNQSVMETSLNIGVGWGGAGGRADITTVVAKEDGP
jgi:hypothetical protein